MVLILRGGQAQRLTGGEAIRKKLCHQNRSQPIGGWRTVLWPGHVEESGAGHGPEGAVWKEVCVDTGAAIKQRSDTIGAHAPPPASCGWSRFRCGHVCAGSAGARSPGRGGKAIGNPVNRRSIVSSAGCRSERLRIPGTDGLASCAFYAIGGGGPRSARADPTRAVCR